MNILRLNFGSDADNKSLKAQSLYFYNRADEHIELVIERMSGVLIPHQPLMLTLTIPT
jgi:hypothetical protein